MLDVIILIPVTAGTVVDYLVLFAWLKANYITYQMRWNQSKRNHLPKTVDVHLQHITHR